MSEEIATMFPIDEQTPQQRARTDIFLLEIAQTGKCQQYGHLFEECDSLATLYLRQELNSDQGVRWVQLDTMFTSLFGKNGFREVIQAYDLHPSRIEETKRIGEETLEIMQKQPPMCRLPRNKPSE